VGRTARSAPIFSGEGWPRRKALLTARAVRFDAKPAFAAGTKMIAEGVIQAQRGTAYTGAHGTLQKPGLLLLIVGQLMCPLRRTRARNSLLFPCYSLFRLDRMPKALGK